jgi:peptidoglycan/xylan/chitin deacetylase (PgdA/CDA1 family)
VTFDDAYRSVVEVARPILARLGVSGTVFVPYIGLERPIAGRDRSMGWNAAQGAREAVRRLRSAAH